MAKPVSLARTMMVGWMLSALFCAAPAFAETEDSFQVSATISSGCSVDGVGTSGSAGDMGTLDFGQDSVFSTATHSTSLVGNQNIRLRCTVGANLRMTIGGGQNSASGVRNLQRTGHPEQRIQYRLYSNAGMTNEIAIGVEQPIAVTSGNAQDIPLPIYARLTLPGTYAAGAYSDIIQVTLTW